jgi:hypothetical protein
MLSPAQKMRSDYLLSSILTVSCLISAHLAAYLIGLFA